MLAKRLIIARGVVDVPVAGEAGERRKEPPPVVIPATGQWM